MKLGEKLLKIAATSRLVKLQDGKAACLDDFWNNFILPLLPPENTVKKWHNLLLKYIKEKDTIFSLRIFGNYSGKNKDRKLLRRGFLNVTNLSFNTVYVDNFFTSYFFSMAYDGYVPKYNEFKKIMLSMEFPVGYIMTTTEKTHAAFPRGKDPRIQLKGYKIAHIYEAGRQFNFSDDINTISKFCQKYFPRGQYNDWKLKGKNKYGTYSYRNILINLSDKQKVYDFLVAHFLRTVHPINYFLVPKKGYITFFDNGKMQNEIGEYGPLISYVEKKFKEKYGSIYEEYLKLIKPVRHEGTTSKNIILNAQYGLKKGIKCSDKSSPKKITTSQITYSAMIDHTAAGFDSYPKKEFFINNQQCSSKEFELALRNTQSYVLRTLYYVDNSSKQDVWNVSNFQETSDINRNLNSGPLRNWRKKGITRIKLELKT